MYFSILKKRLQSEISKFIFCRLPYISTDIPVKSLSISDEGHIIANIEGLNSDLSYQFRIQAINIHGRGNLSLPSGG